MMGYTSGKSLYGRHSLEVPDKEVGVRLTCYKKKKKTKFTKNESLKLLSRGGPKCGQKVEVKNSNKKTSSERRIKHSSSRGMEVKDNSSVEEKKKTGSLRPMEPEKQQTRTGGGHHHKFPRVVKETYSYLYQDNVSCLHPRLCEFMPPESDLNDIFAAIKNDRNIKFVRFSYGTVSALDLQEFTEIHSRKRESAKARAECDWFQKIISMDTAYIQVLEPLNFTAIRDFFQNPVLKRNDGLAMTGNYQPLLKEILTLTCKRWLSDSVIIKCIELLMKNCNGFYVGYLSNVIDFAESGRRVRQRYGGDIATFIFAMNVKLIDNIAHISGVDSTDGNHFSFCVLKLHGDTASVIYVDTLRYPVPISLKNDCLPTFLMGYLRNYNIKKWDFKTVGNSYPRQTCSDICGPATIIGMSLALQCPVIFESLTKETRFNASCPLSHLLPDFSQHSDYLRCVVLNWLMKGDVCVDNLMSLASAVNFHVGKPSTTKGSTAATEVNVSKPSTTKGSTAATEVNASKPSTTEGSTAATEVHVSRQTNDGSKGLPSKLNVPSEVLSLLSGKPFVFLSKPRKPYSLQLCCTLKGTHRKATKIFSCSDAGLLDSDAWGRINSFLKSDGCILWLKGKLECKPNDCNISSCLSLNELLTKKPKIRFCAPHYLHVTCLLKGGLSISKKVKCSSERKNDQVAMKIIQDYLESPDTLEHAKNKMSGVNSAVHDSGDWREDGSVEVGMQTKYFFDAFKFDILKSTEVHLDSVKSVYSGNQSSLNVSVTSDEKWGKTHRFDEHYEYVGNPPPKKVRAITMLIKCASNTTFCRSQCGTLLSSPDCCPEEGRCGACKEHLDDLHQNCDLCAEVDSPYWTVINNQNVCHTCYVYYKKHGFHRPAKLRTNATISSKRKKCQFKHFKCSWQIKLVLYSDNLKCWKVFRHGRNDFFHSEPANQPIKHPNLTTRDTWDFQRVSQKSTAKQIHLNDNRKQPLHFSEESVVKQYHPLQQIQNRIRTLDKNQLQHAIKLADDIPLHGSDWRNTEKILESNLDSVLLFQRGDNDIDRSYHLVLSTDTLCKMVKDYGQYFIGYDTKHDFMSVRFSTGLVSFSDGKNKGKGAAIGISNTENSDAHSLTLQILLANVPCSNPDCMHPQEMYIFDDMNGFFFIRPCALRDYIYPTIQHDKSISIKSALTSMGLQSVLCNFHSLNAFRRHISENSQLILFLRPLETGFKCIMRSWNIESRKCMIAMFESFIVETIPDELLQRNEKDSLLHYLCKNWFDCEWSSDFSAEKLYKAKVEERRNPLIMTDNITERKFRDIDESILGNHLNKSMATFALLLIDKFFASESKESLMSQNSDARMGNISSLEKEMKTIERALDLIRNGQVNCSDLTATDTGGWVPISKRQTQDSGKTIKDLSDNFFTENCEQEQVDIFEEIIENKVDANSENKCLKQLAKTVEQDHPYDAVTNCKTVIRSLELSATNILFTAIQNAIPEAMKADFDSDNQYFCNLELGVCSCYSFIIKGQPYLCKHLYALLILKEGISDKKVIIEQCKKYVPTYKNPASLPASPDIIKFTAIEKLRLHSHLATDVEVDDAKKGRVLKLLHDHWLPVNAIPGRLAERKPHYGGHRRKFPKQDKNNNAITVHPNENIDDPYRPNVNFPDNAKERHGGRKRNRPANRGINFSHVVYSALKTLGIKIKKKSSDVFPTLGDIYNSEDEFEEPTKFNIFSDDMLGKEIDEKLSTIETKRPLKRSKLAKKKKLLVYTDVLCSFCMESGSKTIFSCSSLSELKTHIEKVHYRNPMTCGECYRQSGLRLTFNCEKTMRQHFSLCHDDSQDSKHNISDSQDSQNNISDSQDSHHSISDSQDSQHNISADIINVHNASEIKLKSILKSAGKSGVKNLAASKLKGIRKSKKKKTVRFDMVLPKSKVDAKKAYFCPVCKKRAAYVPPTVGCDKCDSWFHFHCVGLDKSPGRNLWFCPACSDPE